MKFLKGTDCSPDELITAFHDYKRYLDETRPRLAPNVYAFASAPWHYDFTDHRCPHDAWVETIAVEERCVSGKSLDITLTLLGAYHDGHLRLKYLEVQKYELLGQIAGATHGDWLIDEITINESSYAVHEIAFSSGSTISLEFRDLIVDWIPGAVSPTLGN